MPCRILKILKRKELNPLDSQLWIAIQITLSFPFPFLCKPRDLRIFDRKKKKTSNPLEPRFTRVRTRFILKYHSVRAWMLQGKEVRATRRSVSGGRKIDIATRTLGYSVNDDKRLPRTITADNGKNHCWKRGGWNTSPGWRSQE